MLIDWSYNLYTGYKTNTGNMRIQMRVHFILCL